MCGPDLSAEFPPPRTLEIVQGNVRSPEDLLVGREADLARIQAALAKPGIVTLVGPGGVGKTRLALEVATLAASAHDNGSWFVDLSQVATENGVVASVAGVIGAREEPGCPLLETLGRRSALLNALVVLDNCEHVHAGAAQVAQAIASSGHVRVLATSRRPLHVAHETLIEVAPLELLQDAPGLFVDRARSANAGFDGTANMETIRGICRALDGLPLAVELVAARTRLASPKELLDGLAGHIDIATPAGSMNPHATLRDAVAWSCAMLAAPARTLFGRMSVFRSDFTLEAAMRVCCDARLTEIEVPIALEDLIDASLLQAAVGGDSTRYRMLFSIRAVAESVLDAEDYGTVVTRDRHLEWLRSVVGELAGRAPAATAARGPRRARWSGVRHRRGARPRSSDDER